MVGLAVAAGLLLALFVAAPGRSDSLGNAKRLSELKVADVPERARPEPEAKKPMVPVRPPAGKVSLTFDDGPDPNYTPKVLDILDRYDVKATFFVIGTSVRTQPELLREIRDRGHVIAHHSVTHPQLDKVSPAKLEEEITLGTKLIEDVLGEKPTCLRPPYGARNSRVDERVRANGMEVLMWQVDTNDWKKPGAGAIEASGARAESTEVVLMHDGGGERSQTVAALPGMIQKLKAKGLGFAPVCGYPRASLASDAF
jgi:peptidoglycan/xylan/chitin deacetylase (PgdA/CDA1 family)